MQAAAGQALRLRPGVLMKGLFAFTVVMIAAGLVYFTVLGLLHQ